MLAPDSSRPSHRRNLDWLAAVCAAGLGLALFILLRERGFDDAYITYVYAANLARGAGLVFNPGELVLSTTAPLYAILLAGAARLGLDIPHASTALGAIGLALGAWAFWRLGQAWRMPWAGRAGLLLFPLQGLVLATLSNEMSLSLGLTLLGFACAVRGHMARAMACAAVAVLVRPDGMVAAVLVMACALMGMAPAERVRGLVRGGAVFAALALPWLIFAWAQYGAPWPATLAAKQAQGAMVISRSFFNGMLAVLRGYVVNPPQWPTTVLLLLGAGAAIWRRQAWLWIVAWSAAIATAYTALGVSGYFWYYAPLAPGLVALASAGVSVCVSAGSRWLHGTPSRAIALGALALVTLAAPIRGAVAIAQQNDMRLGPYRLAGEWLRANTAREASVGILEAGIVGYYAQRRVIDFAGLLQPDVAAQIRPDRTYDDLALYAWERYRPDYLVLFEQQFSALRATPRFERMCREVTRFAGAPPLVIYACL